MPEVGKQQARNEAQLAWWTYRPPSQRVGPLTWREKFNAPSELTASSSELTEPAGFDQLFNAVLWIGYTIGAYLVGIVVFLTVMAYAIQESGLVIGLLLGIIPAIFIGALAGALWPLWALVLWYWLH